MTTLPNGAPIDAIPAALRQRDQWVLWRLDPKDDKPDELTKVPYTGIDSKGKRRKARANDPKTWLPFDEALRRWAENPNGWAGIGYEFSADDPYTGLDLDACLDHATGQVEPWADKELAVLLPTYAEISPSDIGIKLWVETEQAHKLGAVEGMHDSGGVEVYSHGRFFAVTGRVFEDAPPTIAKVDDAIVEQIIAREQARRQARRAQQPKPATNGARPQRGNGVLDLTKTNGAYPPLPLAGLINVLNGLHDDRWASYDDWRTIGMALHHWAGGDAHRLNTAYALYDQYSSERAPDVYGQVAEKWASFGKRNGDAPLVTVGTLIHWVGEDRAPDEPPHPANDAGELAPEPAPFVALSSFPELPESASIDEAIGDDACPWLDEYIAFSRRWAPDAYDGMHEAIGLWVLATVAARRVYLPWGAGVYTNLYLANCARSSLFTKTTAAEIGVDLVRKAGLAPLLMPDEATPEAFVQGLTRKVPKGFAEMNDEQREFIRRRLAFAGQRSWAYDEFGMKLSAMMREDGTMAAFRGLLRIFDDNKPTYERETIGRGADFVQQPYISLLASLTPADIRPHAKRGSALWGDGFLARFAFIVPPPDAPDTNNRLPEEERVIPLPLLRELHDWHVRLGVPDVAITERQDDKGKGTGFYDATIGALPEQRYRADRAVFDAFYVYRGALKTLTRTLGNEDLDASYSRFPMRALRIALLFASLENSQVIALRHWTRAQAIVERWRANLHHLVDQLQSAGDASRESTLESHVLSTLDRIGQATLRDFRRYLPNAGTEELERLLDVLARNGMVVVAQTRNKTKRYRLPESEASKRRTVELSKPQKSSTVQDHTTRTVEDFDRFDGSTVDSSTVQEREEEDSSTPPTATDSSSLGDDRVPDGDWGSDDDRARLARDMAAVGSFDAAVQVAREIANDTYRRDVEREIARRRRPGTVDEVDLPPITVAEQTIARLKAEAAARAEAAASVNAITGER